VNLGSRTRLSLQFAHLEGGRARILATRPLTADASVEVLPSLVTWRFFTPPEGRKAPRNTDVVRVVHEGNGEIGNAIAVTTPVTYSTQRLTRVFEREGSHVLTVPFILPYFPCAREPRLGGGILEVPRAFVGFSTSLEPSLGRSTGTFDGVRDLYSLVRVPLVDPKLPRLHPWTEASTLPTDLALYVVDQRIPGARLAPITIVRSG
jgi:hypothetical protein